MKFLFQMDDPEKININEDSTYMLIKESLNRGIDCYYNDPSWVFSEINKVNKIKSNVTKLSLKKNNQLSYQRKALKEIDLEKMNAIFIRQDPPFDLNYISNTYLLDQLKKPLIFNNPKEIRNFPEKHIMMNFPELTPPTLISSDVDAIINFIKKNKEVIIKPAYGNGGLGIQKINNNNSNLNKLLRNYIKKFSNCPIIIQRFLKNFKKGDKRIILINGDIAGAVLRVPRVNSIKANFHAGGTAVKTNISKKEIYICKKIRPFLLKKGLFFAGIDVIDGYLTEINITSPTGIQEINRLNNSNIEKDIIDFVLKSLK